MSQFRLSLRASQDVADIHAYIARENSDAATRLIQEFFDFFHLLAKNPQMGELRADLRPDLRLVSHRNYVIFFYPFPDGVEIAGVVHGARDIEALFPREAL